MKRKKLIILAGIVVVIVVIANFVVPALLDPNQYKAEITRKVEAKTGYKLDIAGDIKLSALPFIKGYANDVTLSTGSKTLVNVKEVAAYVDILPLLSGKVQIGKIKIIEPKVTLEKTETGDNWTVQKKQPVEAASETTKEVTGAKNEVQIESIEIVDGEVSYINKGKETKLDKINVEASLASLAGPANFDGKLNYKNKEVALKGKIENFSNPSLDIKLTAFGTEANLKGGIKKAALDVKSDDINPLLAEFEKEGMFSMAKAPLNVSGNFAYENDQVNINDLKARLGSSEGVGALVMAIPKDQPMQLAANLQFKKIVVDELMPSAQQTKDDADDDHDKSNKSSNGMLAQFQIAADEVAYKKGVYNNLNAKIEVEGEQISVTPFSIDIPGGGRIDLYGILGKEGQGKLFDGKVNVSGNSLRKVIEGFEVKLDSVKPGKPGKFVFNSNLVVSGEQNKSIELSGIESSIDDMNIKGSLITQLGEVMEISFTGTVDSINLDSLLVASTGEPAASAGKPAQGKPIDLGWLTNFKQKIKLNTAIGNLRKSGQDYSNIRFAGNIEKGLLNIETFSVNSNKINASGKLALDARAARPKINAAINADKIDIAGSANSEGGSGSGESSAPGKWSQKPISLSPLDQIDGDFKANIGTLVTKAATLTDVKLVGYADAGKITLKDITAKVYDGSINASAKVESKTVPSFEVQFDASNISLPKMVQSLAKNDRVQQGVMNIKGNFKSSGINQKVLIDNLDGSAGLSAEGTIVRGFDLEAFANQVTNINNIAGVLSLATVASSDNNVTKIKTISGSIYAQKGIISTQGIEMDAGVGQGTYKGTVDLPKWNMETNAVFKLTMPDNKDRPSIGIRIYGPLDAPKKSLDLEQIRKWAADRLARGLIRNNVISERYEGVINDVNQNGVQGALPGLINTLGNRNNNFALPAEQAPASGTAAPTQPQSQDEQLINAFGGLLKKKKKKEE